MSSQRPPPRVRPVRWLQQQWAVALLLQACLLAGALPAVSAQNITTPATASPGAALSTAEATADRKLASPLPTPCLACDCGPDRCAGCALHVCSDTAQVLQQHPNDDGGASWPVA